MFARLLSLGVGRGGATTFCASETRKNLEAPTAVMFPCGAQTNRSKRAHVGHYLAARGVTMYSDVPLTSERPGTPTPRGNRSIADCTPNGKALSHA